LSAHALKQFRLFKPVAEAQNGVGDAAASLAEKSFSTSLIWSPLASFPSQHASAVQAPGEILAGDSQHLVCRVQGGEGSRSRLWALGGDAVRREPREHPLLRVRWHRRCAISPQS
jgi:hypothetical protein